jgi:succinyl-CoA synthetase beta subunit
MFVDLDLALLEINPLVITNEGNLHCLDAKIVIDSNALFRHPKLKAMYDPSQEDERERRAVEWELNYVALEGNIGCMVNGAGWPWPPWTSSSSRAVSRPTSLTWAVVQPRSV